MFIMSVRRAIEMSCVASTGAAGLFAIQKVLQRKLPYPLQWNLLISIGEK